MTCPAELHAPVGAHVLDDVHVSGLVADHDHRSLADDGADEVAGVGDLGLETYVAPVAAVEEPLELDAVQLVARVHLERDS